MSEDIEYASAADLVAGDLDDSGEDITLPSGKRVRVRGLSRYELMFNGKGLKEDENQALEARNVKCCLVSPVLTIQQVEQWQRNSLAGRDFKFLTEKIRDLSRLGEGADKSGLRNDGGES